MEKIREQFIEHDYLKASQKCPLLEMTWNKCILSELQDELVDTDMPLNIMTPNLMKYLLEENKDFVFQLFSTSKYWCFHLIPNTIRDDHNFMKYSYYYKEISLKPSGFMEQLMIYHINELMNAVIPNLVTIIKKFPMIDINYKPRDDPHAIYARFISTLWMNVMIYVWDLWLGSTSFGTKKISPNTINIFKQIDAALEEWTRSYSRTVGHIMGLWLCWWFDNPIFEVPDVDLEQRKTKKANNYKQMRLFLQDLCTYIPKLRLFLVRGIYTFCVGSVRDIWQVESWRHDDDDDEEDENVGIQGFEWDDGLDVARRKLFEFLHPDLPMLILICFQIPEIVDYMCEMFVIVDVLFKGAMYKTFIRDGTMKQMLAVSTSKLLEHYRREKISDIIIQNDDVNDKIQQFMDNEGVIDTIYEFMIIMGV